MGQTPRSDPGAPAPEPGDGPALAETPEPVDGTELPIEVAVTRTGGFAGLTRQWRAEPPPAEAPQWITLIAQCPWDAASPDPVEDQGSADGPEGPLGPEPGRGADRFVWWIHARCGEADEREAELPDDAVVGAWRELVDAVREWNKAASA
ncbi:protealysin inhibitor emfourin [Microbacterium sp. CFBP9034]|uniref:protealysin inhibitor emfourin n=1 Tax=Microbacterium sp. CFBP9034 TaxID=3096540 RepID=UPI002A6ACCF4|nr:protealysin inhibitor emfourin [Microbacterium sp. CFBP9034]MDY0909084.1 protealysin inhibitor emfourin [Microbacterium sp. CFBP9034]